MTDLTDAFPRLHDGAYLGREPAEFDDVPRAFRLVAQLAHR